MIESLLKDCEKGQGAANRTAISLSIAGALSGIALLALSGWFLTGAALAGAGGLIAVRGFNYLLPSAAIRMLAITRTLSRYGERLIGHKAALQTLAQLRPALFLHLAQREPQALFAERSGVIAARLGSDVDRIENDLIHRLGKPAHWLSALAGTGGVVAMGGLAWLPWLAALIVMRWMPLQFARKRMLALSAQLADSLAALRADYADYARASADIAIYGLEQRVAQSLGETASEHDAARLQFTRIEAIVQACQTALTGVMIAAMFLLADAPAPLLALGALAALGAAEAWGQLVMGDLRETESADAIVRLEALLALPIRTVEDETSISASPTLEFVSGNSRLIVGPGERLLLDGPSGAGKTRLAAMLGGLRVDAPETLLIDGNDARALPLDVLRQISAPAMQEPGLIAGSVADNLRMARPGITESDMWQALDTACASDFVQGLPDGLYQWLGESGARLSGGQQRRIALARALLAKRPWLVLDEPSEGLDAETEARLIDRLDRWLADSNTGLILISHRPMMAALAAKRLQIGNC